MLPANLSGTAVVTTVPLWSAKSRKLKYSFAQAL